MEKQLKSIRTGLSDNASRLFEDLEAKDEKYMEIYVPEKETWIKRYEIGKLGVFPFENQHHELIQTSEIFNIENASLKK